VIVGDTCLQTAIAHNTISSPRRASLFVLGMAAFMVQADARVVDPLLHVIATDFQTTPPNAAAATPAPINPSTVNTVENVERLKLDFETILPLHGPGAATRADLYKAINKPVPDLSVILAAVAIALAARLLADSELGDGCEK